MQNLSATMWQAAFTAIPEPTIILDDRGIVQFINPAACVLLNLTPENVLGQPIEALPYAYELRAVQEFWSNPKGGDSETQPDLDAWLTSVDDQGLRFKATPIENALHERLGFLIQVRDITSNRTVREAFISFLSDSGRYFNAVKVYSQMLVLDSEPGTTEHAETLRALYDQTQALARVYAAGREYLWNLKP